MTLVQLIQLAISVSIFLMVFALGLEAGWRDATYLFRRPSLLFRSILSMNVLMAFFAVAVASSFDLDRSVKIAILALAVSPVPPMLPRKQRKLGGSTSYEIGLLVAAVLLATIIVPASIELIGVYFGKDVHMPFARVVPIVLMSAVVPMLAGIAVHHLVPDLAHQVAGLIAGVASFLLVIAILPILVTMSGEIWDLVGDGALIALVMFTLVGLVIGHLLGGPEPQNRADLALATSARHPGIALAIATLNFPEQKTEVMAVIICHLLIGAVVSLPYAVWRKRYHPAKTAAK